MKKIIFFIFLSLSLCIQAQETLLKGKIVDAENGKKLDAVICEIWDADNNSLSFSISEQDGSFIIKKPEKGERISFRLLGYAEKELFIRDISNPEEIKINLERKSVQLKEVVVRVPPIKQKNDTISYNVDRFRGQEDRSIGDVLKKLPGIKVDEKGSVTYQGDPINKFYIEGKDLLGGQYNIATNNLSADAISEVEVLENNQHMKALKGLQHSDNAAINLKLKEGYKVKPFGEVQAGIGGFPTLYDEKLFTTLLTNKIQTIVNLKTNNRGKDMMNELEEKLDLSASFTYEELPSNLISLPASLSFPFSEDRYLFNENFLASINSLVSLNKDTDLKANFSYGINRVEQERFLEQNYLTEGSSLIIQERSEQLRKFQNYRFSFIIEHNSLNKFIKNETLFQRKENRIYPNMEVNGQLKKMTQKNHPTYIQNNFYSLFKYKDDKTISINSFFRYLDNQEYLFSLNSDESYFHEQIRGKYLVNKNSINSSFSLGGHRLNLGLNTVYKRKQYNTDLSFSNMSAPTVFIDNLPNGIENEIELFKLSFVPNYQIKKNNQWIININLPIAYNYYSIKTDNASKSKEEKFIFTPSLSATYKYNHRWEFYSRLGYNFQYADENTLLSHPYLQNYRSIYIPSGEFYTSSNYSLTSKISYKNIIDMFFFNLTAYYMINDLDYIWSSFEDGTWAYYTTERKKNTGRQFNLSSDLSKIFVSQQLSLSLNPSYTQVKSKIIQQNVLVNNTTHISSLNSKIEWKKIKNTSLIYHVGGGITWNNNNLSDTQSLKNLKQKLQLYYFPTKMIDVSITGEHTLYEALKNQYSSCVFLDMSIKYRLGIWELGFQANNLLDKSKYALSTFSSVNTYYQSNPLRGREFMFTAKRNF